nr:unnamed protein product [Callosobruchus analis]
MSNTCGICGLPINRTQPGIFCSGVCKKRQHVSCVRGATADLPDKLSKIPGLSWKCDACTDVCVTIDACGIKAIIAEGIQEAVKGLTDELESLKNYIRNVVAKEFPRPAVTPVNVPRYADVLKNTTIPAVIIEPESEQDAANTKSVIMQKINPVDSNLHISKIKQVKNGGILVGCKTSDDNERLRKLAQENLPTGYKVRTVGGVNPRIRITGLSENYSEEVLLNYISKMNRGIIDDTSAFKVISMSRTRKNSKIFQAVLQVDRGSYERVLNAGNIFVGYDSCVVFDAVEIHRCFNCNEYQHSSKFCKKSPSCPRCGENHLLKDCKSTTVCCVNCVKLVNKGEVNVSTHHAVWDINACTSYKRATDKLRSDLLISSTSFSCIALTETWLKPSVFNEELFNCNYNVFRKDRDHALSQKSRGGGILFAVRDNISAVQLDLSQFFDSDEGQIGLVELLAVLLKLGHTTLLVIVIYIPPNTSSQVYEKIFEALCFVSCVEVDKILILGDFNIPSYSAFVKDNTHSTYCQILVNFLDCMQLSQHNLVYNVNGKLLDLVLSDCVKDVNKSLISLVVEDSHHPSLFITVNLSVATEPNFKSNRSGSFNFKKANYLLLYEQLTVTNWNFLEDIDDPDEACIQFYSTLSNIFDLCVPKYKPARNNRRFPTWFNSDIIKNIRKKEHVLKTYNNCGRSEFLTEFKYLRAKIKADINNAFKIFCNNIQNDIKANPKRFWSFINLKKGFSRIPALMSYNDCQLSSPADILNTFARYFSESFQNSKSGYNVSLNYRSTCISNRNITINKFSEESVKTALKVFKPKLTAGPDGIPAFLLKDCHSVLAKPLMILFNTSIKHSRFPAIWKNSRICPIFKNKGDKSDISNYRPITIISNFSKLFESLLYTEIFPQVRNSLSMQQHGFVKGRSTVTNLIQATQFIAETTDEHLQTDVIYSDFSKAFDRLDHDVLLNKLLYFGFSYNLLVFFASYLSERHQYVSYSGHKSHIYLASSGVPQGSVLGPLLFLLFINDISLNFDVSCLLYADDAKLLCKIRDVSDCHILQDDLVKLHDWCELNKLQLNVNKCFVVSYSNRDNDVIFDYAINNVTLTRASQIKDLGVTFDKKLSFSTHIDNITSKANRSLGFIFRTCKNFNDIHTLKVLYYSLVRSSLEYASIVWSPHHQKYITQLEAVQRRFLKYLYFKTTTQYPPTGFPHDVLLDKFSIYSLKDRREHFGIAFLKQLVNNKIDCAPLLQKLNFFIPRLNSRHSATFYADTPRTDTLKHSPLHTICDLCNSKGIDLFYSE